MTKKKVNKKPCTNNKCKVICIECKNIRNNLALSTCGSYYEEARCEAYKTVDTSCVDGEDTCKLELCKDHNKNGNCTRYKALPYIQLRDLLETYIHDEGCDYFARTSIKGKLAEDLLRVINGEESQYLEKIYTGDSPYDEHTVITKEAIRRSITQRGYRLDSYEEKDNYDGGSMTDEEIREERGWIQRVRRWLDEP